MSPKALQVSKVTEETKIFRVNILIISKYTGVLGELYGYFHWNKKTLYMFNLNKFIADSVTFRPVSMFAADIEANKDKLSSEIKGKKVCVIGGAGSIGSSFIKAVLRFEPKSVVVVDLNENGLAELVRDVRSM